MIARVFAAICADNSWATKPFCILRGSFPLADYPRLAPLYFSQSSNTFTISAISQSFNVTPADIVGVIFKV